MRLELKLALIGALSKIVIFFILLILMQQVIDKQALQHTDRSLIRMKEKTMEIVAKIGIKSFLDIEKDSVYASYNLLKDEYITIDLNSQMGSGKIQFSEEARIIEDEEFDYRILNYTFDINNQHYILEIGKNVQLINALNKTMKNISVAIILLVLLSTIVFDIGINKYLLHPLNRMIIPKLKTITNPETFVYSELHSSTSDFVYLNNALNELMHKVTAILKNQQKFTANVSHELFTPISIMQSKLENLLTSGNLPDQFVGNVMDQQNHLNRLQQIIKALLLIARIENDQFAKIETVVVHEVVEEIILNIEDRAEMKNITIENRVDPGALLPNVNKSLLYILIFNLVSNAIKYNKDGGWIRVSTNLSGGNFCIEVSDNGIGIEPDQIASVFDRFKRTDPTSGEGHGLGLSIVSSIVNFHGGSIDVKSAKGEGSVFKVLLPLKNVNFISVA
ncbi:MAG TPA: HAMP domain-containing sensor histidine kinase, partial [Anaerovoracaceae bacterium]|nr:HAMP domain-containing sensor histidine kinase [Anaerovoracaceae bacterium]